MEVSKLMASLRLEILLSIPESPTGTKILADNDGSGGIILPKVVVDKLKVVRSTIRDFKQYATKINEGEPNEEATIRAVFHICHHDEGDNHPPCEEVQEI